MNTLLKHSRNVALLDSAAFIMELKVHTRRIRWVIVAGLTMLVSYQLLRVVRAFMADPPLAAYPSVVRPAVAATAKTSLAALADAHLFGTPTRGVKPVEVAVAVEETQLTLTLTGVLTGLDEAIIVGQDGREESYRVGQLLEGSDIALHSVQPTHVLLSRSGRLERLSFEEWRAAGASSGRAQAFAAAPMPAPPPSYANTAPAYAAQDSVQRMGSILNRMPTSQGNHVGLRVKPSTAQAQELGLEPGDVIVDLEPTVPQDGFTQPDYGDGVVVTVIRNGVPHNVPVNGNQLASLQSVIE